jgi:hypothetical protein
MHQMASKFIAMPIGHYLSMAFIEYLSVTLVTSMESVEIYLWDL